MYAVNLGFEIASKDACGSGSFCPPIEGGASMSSHNDVRRVSFASDISVLPPWDMAEADFEKSRFSATEMDDRRTTYSSGLEENVNGGGDEEKRRCNGRIPFFKEMPGAREEGTSCFPSSAVSPPNDDDDYGRQKQQAPMKCQPLGLDSGNVAVSDAARAYAGNGLANGELESGTKNCSKAPSSNDGFLNDGKGRRVITATAPPHLRSYYSQENIIGSLGKKVVTFDDDNLFRFQKPKDMEESGGVKNHPTGASPVKARPQQSIGPLDNSGHSTSVQRGYVSSAYFPQARFDNVGDIETSNLRSNAFVPAHCNENRPPPPPYEIAVAGNSSRVPKPSDIGCTSVLNGQFRPVGQAPMFVTAANRKFDHGDENIPQHGQEFGRKCQGRIYDRRYVQNADGRRDWTSSDLAPRFDSSSLSSSKASVSFQQASPKVNGTERPVFGLYDSHIAKSTSRSLAETEFSSGQGIQRGCSVENVPGLGRHYSSNTRWPSTPCIANASPSSRPPSFLVGRTTASSAGSYSVPTATVTVPTSVHSIQSARVSSYVNPLPEIRENVAVVSLPATPTTSEPSPYLLPSVVSDRRSLVSAPWALVRTGAVSRLVKAVSCDSATATFNQENGDGLSPKDVHYLSNLHRVTDLAEYFEKGDVDHVGPLKLYHAQVYKRELEKICSENYGSVLTKAQCFEGAMVRLPARPSPIQVEIKDNEPYERSSHSFSRVSDDIWSRGGVKSRAQDSENSVRMYGGSNALRAQGISFSETTTFPTASERNLNGGLGNLPDFTLTDCNDQGGGIQEKREGAHSRRTSYVMATTASPRNVVAATGTRIGGRAHREAAVSFPVSEDASSSGARHEETEEEGEEVECGNRRENARGSSSVANTPESAEEADKALLGSKTDVRGLTRLQRKAPTAIQEAPRLSRLQIPDSMERKNSSGSSLSVTPTPTPSPTSGAKHARIQRFISFFSGDNSSLTRYSDGCVAGPGSSTSLSSCYTGASSSSNQAAVVGDRSKRISTTFASPPTIEGPLVHKQLISEIGGIRKRPTDRNWKDYWAVLHGSSLYLCRERPAVRYRSETAISEESPLCYGLPEDAVCIDVESCIADIAYDYLKRKHVFRVTTQRQTEHLFQATDSQTMIRWIESLQRCSPHENQLDGISSSMALIIKRYEAQSQSVSPSVKQRRSTGVGGSKSPSSVMPNSQQEQGNRCESDGAKVSSVVSPNRIQSSGVNSNPSLEKMDKGDNTPGKTRKWRRVRKSGSCPVPSPRANGAGSNPDAMFGARLEDCPTSGEDDFVPLIVQLCVKVVESQGLEAVGVYRIPGNTAAVNSLIATLDKGFENANFNDSRWRDVNVVSSLLKAYFRKLPDPLLTDKLYQHFIDASRMENHAQKLKRVRSLIEKLPTMNYETLKYLLFHLRRVVAHSGVNKMESRNLALMFGPSLVRPCGDSSMTTMVTHMSDQCKIVELLITYCDWIFSPAGNSSDVPTVPLPTGSAETDLGNTSFADMTDLLRRVKTTEEDLERTKESIVKSILNVRRGSRKLSKGKLASPESVASIGSSSTPQPPSFVSCSGSSTSASVNGHHAYSGHEPLSRDVAKAASASPSMFNERNIDEEIESRQQRAAAAQATVSTSSKGVSADLRMNNHHSHPETNGTNGNVKGNEPCARVDVGVVFRSNNDNSQEAVEEMRRRREDHIYAARRIFIVGTEGNDILQRTPPVDTVAKMDLLAQHSRHLNVNPQSLDVLSPETREKIRRLQTDSQLLRSKSHWQTQQLKKVANERQRIELAWERAKQEYEQDDFLDDLADNPRVGLAVMTATSNPHLSVASNDALSTSSDYSTTSSILVCYDGMMDKRRQHPLQKQQQKLMSISCTGALPISDCSSDDPSPNSTHSPKPVQFTSGTYGVTYSPSKGTSVGVTANRSPVDQQQNAIPFQPPSFCSVNQRSSGTAAGSSPQHHQQAGSPQQLYDRSRLKHVAPEVLFHAKPASEEQKSSYAGSSDGSIGIKNRNSPRHSTLQKAKPWYDELADDENDLNCVVRSSFASSSESNCRDANNVVDQNANNLSTKVPSPSKANVVNNSNGEEKRTRILAPAERGPSRISQKIKFRSKSSSAEKRKDSRRHTLTDMETLKNVLFGGGSSREQQHSVREKALPTAPAPTSNSASKAPPPATTTANKQSKAGKLKAWLKESFRKSSPDLYDADNLDDGAADDNGPKSGV